ncbi:hypothetical protein J1N35_044548 [Gossypium stocksii]|uniref:Uncharacterized protein n=1 Tax=Gossypium stocksii TaxID=47602 RepID=A0A9D3ZFU9_9ROSI|nr:hypothetical protein J1N35_044548 [Gossypium stocksii]
MVANFKVKRILVDSQVQWKFYHGKCIKNRFKRTVIIQGQPNEWFSKPPCRDERFNHTTGHLRGRQVYDYRIC